MKYKGTSYPAIHCWLRYNFGSANKCENLECTNKSINYDWALIHGKEYDHIKENFIQLCRSCHVKYDMTEETKQKISQTNKKLGIGKWLGRNRLGMSHTQKTKNKISESVRRYYLN